MEDTRSEMEKEILAIERHRSWQIMWQQQSNGGRRLIECFAWPAARNYVLVIKDFDKSIRGHKPWPKMTSCEVLFPVDGSNTWDGLNAALNEIERKVKEKILDGK